MITYLYFSEVSFSAFPQDELGHSEVRVPLLGPDHDEDEGLGVLAGEEGGLDDVVKSHLAVRSRTVLPQLSDSQSGSPVFLRILTMSRSRED